MLLENNKRWANAKLAEDPHHFDNLSQKPKYLFFGCSISRVPAYDMLGLRYVKTYGKNIFILRKLIFYKVPGK